MVKRVFERQTLPFSTDFSLAGTRCLLSTNSHEILRQAMRWQGSAPASGERTFWMEMMEDPSFKREERALSHFRGLRHVVLANIESKAFVAFDLLRKRVMGVICPAVARDDSFWDQRLLPVTIGVLGTTLGVAPLHCACLDRRGKALLVAGASGAGKSTLSAALAQRGFAVVSDDWSYLSRTPGGLIAYGLSATVKLLPDAVRFFRELHGYSTRKTFNGEFAYEIDPVRTLSSAAATSSKPQWLLFLERTVTRGSHFIPCRSDYARQFFEEFAERLPEELPHMRIARSEVINALSACRCWIFRTGESPQGAAEAIQKFLENSDHVAA